jgi:hypothetical protein
LPTLARRFQHRPDLDQRILNRVARLIEQLTLPPRVRGRQLRIESERRGPTLAL